jgi:Tfp pilus assembly protein PilF
MLFGEGVATKPSGGGFKIRRRSGKIFGPFDEAQVVDMLVKGELMGNEDVAPEGGAWTPIGAVSAFGDALRKLTAEPAVAPEPDDARASQEPQRLVPYGDRMAPARVSEGGLAKPPRRWVKGAVAAAVALLVAGAGVAGVLRYGQKLSGLLRRGDAARAGALLAQARAAAAKADYPSERAALDLAAQAVAADPRSPDPAGLHAAIVAALERRHGAPQEALAQARAAADRLDQDEKGEVGTLAARLAVTLATTPGPATQPHEGALEQAARTRPPDAELLALLAGAALARGDGARADALFGQLAAIEPGVRALHGAGRAALARRDAAAAKAAFAKALAKEPNHLPTRLELAALAEAEGDVSSAEAHLAPLLEKGAEAKLGPAERARALVVRGRILSRSVAGAAEADAAFTAAVQADPRLTEARVALAQHRLRRGDPTGAVAATDPVADQAARTPPLAAVRIRSLALAGRALDASSLAAAALQGAPGDLALLLAKAAALEASGKPEEATALYRDAARRDPAAFEPRLALGRIALSRRDLPQAASEIAAAVEKGPREPAAHAALGDLRAAQGDAAGAEAAYRAALALDPEHANAEIGLAKLAFSRGDVAGARARLERALVAEPRSVDGRVAYGTLLWKAKDLPAAEQAFQAAVDLAPRHALALSRLGAVKLERGDPAGAVKLLTTASNEDGRLAEARLWLGRALLAKGETPGAIGQLKKAVDLDPGAAESRLYLGDALERSGSVQEAIEQYRAAAAVDPKSPDPHERIGVLYASNGRCDEAVPAFERAVAVAPRVSRLRIALGDCKARLGKNEEAARIFREVLKADPAQAQVLYPLARAVHESESARAALPWYERAAREDPRNPMPHYYLGYMYKERNQRQKAVVEFRKYLALKPDADEKRDIEAEIEDLGGTRAR